MVFRVEYADFIDACRNFTYASCFLNVPDHIQEALNDIFDNADGIEPDDVYLNDFREIETEELLVSELAMLSRDKYGAMKEDGILEEYIEDNIDEIEEELSYSHNYLGRDGFNVFYILE